MVLELRKPRIIDRGRGPEIEGTRITVFDVMDYYTVGWHHSQIAMLFLLSSAQVLEAIRYIEDHREQVDAEYQRMVERSKRGNPPEVQAKLEESHRRFVQRVAEWRRLHPKEAKSAGPAA